MNSLRATFRRNLLLVSIVHAALVGGLVLVEQFYVARAHTAVPLELVVPADILGDLPVGPGHGKGAYAPPSPSAEEPPGGAGPASMAFTPEERPAPAPRPVAPAAAQVAKPQPGDVALPQKPKKPAADTKRVASAAAKPSTSSSANTGTSGGASAAEIRARFARALGGTGQPGGTPYGDGRPAGGGSGRSSVIGSPDGSPDGVIGGIGKGSPFWWYYLHIRDRMYEAWERPAEATDWDRRLMTTVLVRVARDGRVLQVTLKVPSGNSLMDQTALAAARRVTRLDPLPDGLGGETADIMVNFQLES